MLITRFLILATHLILDCLFRRIDIRLLENCSLFPEQGLAGNIASISIRHTKGRYSSFSVTLDRS